MGIKCIGRSEEGDRGNVEENRKRGGLWEKRGKNS
jgi:hypothetical protein